jgi:virginiamycin B lyase
MMSSTGPRLAITPAIVGFCLLLGGCTGKSVPATVSKLELASTATITAVSLGRDGRVWFAVTRTGPGPTLGYIDESGDIELTQLDPVSYGHVIGDLAVDATHGVWATMPCYKVGPGCGGGYARFGGDFGPLTKIHSLGKVDPEPVGIAMMGDGSVWIAERNANAIAHVTPDDKKTVFKLADPEFKPVGAEANGEGGAYFDGPEPGKILAADRRGRIRTYVLPARTSHTSSAVRGLDGTIWVAEYDADKIVAIDSKGAMTEYAVPTPNAGPASLSVDRRGVVWFIEFDGQKIGRINSDGTVKDAYLPLDVGTPVFLVAAPDDTLVVIGYTKGLLRTSLTWAIARIPESTAAM